MIIHPRTLQALGAAILATGFLGCASITLEDVLGAPDTQSTQPLNAKTVADGLREALRVGSDRAVGRTARVDGFLANELIRIVIPNELDSMANALRRIGLGSQVDRLEVGLNRAAEEASSEAREIFWTEIKQFTIPDAFAILRGSETAATELLKQRTTPEIRRRFSPIVSRKINEVGLGRLYGDLRQSYNRLPLVTKPAIDLEEYVTEEALNGLFQVLGEEERKIRENPVARTTELLRRVFGSARSV